MQTLVKSLSWGLLWVLACSPSGPQTPRSVDSDAVPNVVIADGTAASESDTDLPEVLEVVQETVEEEVIEEAAVEEVDAPLTLAQKFAAADGAGGLKLCMAMVVALSPDWNLAACDAMAEDAEGEDHKARCYAQRAPLKQFAEDICKAVIEESLRLDFDPAMPIAVMERESSIGRVYFDSASHTYRVNTDVCELFLVTSRIVSREPGHRAGTEVMVWTYQTGTGAVRQNRQAVRVLEERDDGILVNTCAAGEAGVLQTIENEFRRGTVIEATGQRLTGSAAQRREAVLEDPVLQVRLGCQALARHRDLCPEEQRVFWPMWIPVYNIGSYRPDWDQWREYSRKVMGHYLQACKQGWFADDQGNTVMVSDVWPECTRVQAVYDALPEN